MGTFYTNITLRETDGGQVKLDLATRGLTAFVSRSEHDALVVFERVAEEQDPVVLDDLAAVLSARFRCVALAVTNHDDSVLMYSLFERGQRVDDYNSAPDYFGELADDLDRGGDHERLARAFGVPDRASQLAVILQASEADEGFVFETDRHEQLVGVLGIPRCAVGAGYTYLAASEYPAGYGAEDFEHVGEA